MGIIRKYFGSNNESFFWKDEGFSTAAMVLALLITLSLILTAARVYEINTLSSEIQETADAAALAAENVVAEYMVVAMVCDGVLLSLSLGSLISLGIGIAASCTPVTAGFASVFYKASNSLKNARDTFNDKATHALNTLQSALPFHQLHKDRKCFQPTQQLRIAPITESSYFALGKASRLLKRHLINRMRH